MKWHDGNGLYAIRGVSQREPEIGELVDEADAPGSMPRKAW